MEQALVDRLNGFCEGARSAPFDPAIYTLAYGAGTETYPFYWKAKA